MDSDLHIEVSGFRISVSRVTPNPDPNTSEPPANRSLESSTSSFEIVDFGAGSPSYSSPPPTSPPYPLQASGPSAPPGAGVGRGPSAKPQVRSLYSAQASGSSSQAPLAPVPSLPPTRAEAAVPSSQLPLPVRSQVPSRSVLASPLRVPEYPLQGPLRPRSEVEASFPGLPRCLLDSCRVLRGGSLSWQSPAQRAWTAGCWARAVLEAQAESPNPSGSVGLSNRIYCVIAAEGLESPAVVHSFPAYRAIVGELRRGGSISHGFPSEAEARLYFAGAGLDYPQA